MEDDGKDGRPDGRALAGTTGHQGHGLLGMQERARSRGGRLLVDASPRGGRRVRRLRCPAGVRAVDVIHVVVADDDPRVRADFSTLLELEVDIHVPAVAADGYEAVEACAQWHPDVVVMDVRMPRLNGIDATRQVLSAPSARTRVLVVTTFDLDDYVLGAVRAGASGFLLKDQAAHALAAAVRTVASGEGIVSPRATARLLQELVPSRGQGEGGPLTVRELEVVRLVALGLNNEDIARTAAISRATVKTHVSNVLVKLGLTSRIQVAVRAYRRGLVRLDDRP